MLKSTGSRYPGSNHWVDHLWVHADTLAVDNVRHVLNNFAPAFTDVWAAGETDKGLDVFAGTAEGTGAPGSVTSWVWTPRTATTPRRTSSGSTGGLRRSRRSGRSGP